MSDSQTSFKNDRWWELTPEQRRVEEVALVDAECARRVLVSEHPRQEMKLWRELLTESIDRLAVALISEDRNLLLNRRLPASVREPYVIDNWYASVRPLVRGKVNKLREHANKIETVMFFRRRGPMERRETVHRWNSLEAVRVFWEACCRDASWPQYEVKQRVARLLFRLHEIALSAEFWNQSDACHVAALRLHMGGNGLAFR